jgi:uncharacterized protein (TIGR00255 family)
MTAFARQEWQEEWGHLCWELRSVNHRFLEITIRLPEELRSLEGHVREILQQHLKRGKVDCHLHWQARQSVHSQFTVNHSLLRQLWAAVQEVQTIAPQAHVPNVFDLLRWQGVLESNPLDMNQVGERVLTQLKCAISALVAQREREGAQLAHLMDQRCVGIAAELQQIRQELPWILQAQRERLLNRLAELSALNNERLEQEMVLFAQKQDVAEELDRLDTHLAEIQTTLQQTQSVGRRLDFLVQELHREANTLGAKSAHINTTRSVIELKVLIEQMREQTQNIE